MSMNIRIFGERTITYIVGRKTKTGSQTTSFECYQTDTNSTYKIKDSPDPAQAYIDWCMQYSKPEKWPVYADDDLFDEREPVRYETYDPYADHVASFKEWLIEMENEGYTVKYEVV